MSKRRSRSKSMTGQSAPRQILNTASISNGASYLFKNNHAHMLCADRLADHLWCDQIRDDCLRKIAQKALSGSRLTASEGLYLLRSKDETTICDLADRARKNRVGDDVFYATTLFIHPTNLCELSCPMCSYAAKPGQAKAWFHSPGQIIDQVKTHLSSAINEVHIVGGLWKEANLDYYRDILQGIKSLNPKLHIKALTPVEFDYLAHLHNISVSEVLSKMKSWGLGSIPGGGAEVLVEHVRRKIAPQKISSQRYLEIHATAHRLGIPSNITLLFGHVESDDDLIIHWQRVRRLQDQTNGIGAFVPLQYHLENNALGKRLNRIAPKSLRRIYPLSRLMLDNIPNIKVLWNYVGLKQAQDALNFGANDLGSTALEEKIVTAAGGVRVCMNPAGMRRAIAQMARCPKLAHSGLKGGQF